MAPLYLISKHTHILKCWGQSSDMWVWGYSSGHTLDRVLGAHVLSKQQLLTTVKAHACSGRKAPWGTGDGREGHAPWGSVEEGPRGRGNSMCEGTRQATWCP